MKRFSILLLLSMAAIAVAHAEQTADEVINEYIEARGGMDAIKGIKTFKAEGKMSMGAMEFPLYLTTKRPNKVHTVFEAQGMKGVQAFDGETGWAIMPFMGKPDPEKMADDQLKQIKNQADMDGALIDYASKGHSVELVGETEVEGTPVIELKLTKKGGDVVHYFLDKEYKLEVMRREKMDMMGQQVEVETFFSDYNEVDDTVMPQSMAVKMNGQVVQNLTFTKVETNMEIDDSLFSMPETEAKDAAE